MIRSFTLIELIIVVVIIGILSTFAMPAFRTTQERALDREAIANLKLIQAAQRIHRMERGFYYPVPLILDTNVTNINDNLKLFLNERHWDYAVWNTGCARATRLGPGGRSWFLTINDGTTPATDGEPDAGAGCP